MIGFITTPEISASVTQAISDAQTSRDLPVFWLLSGMPILSGEHVGKHFIPADDVILNSPLRGDPPLKPSDFPEFLSLITLLGGLDSRVNIEPETIAQ